MRKGILDGDLFLNICLGFLAALTLSKFALFFLDLNYYYDSYTFYDISKSIFSGELGKINLARNFQPNLEQFRNSAFPLLFPFLMSIFNCVLTQE